jgi:predicted dehydrogenase
MKVACVGMGWWSDVLADAMQRSGKFTIAACYTRSEEKRQKFAAKYGCRAARSYEELLNDRSVEAIINTTPNSVHRETTVAAAPAGKHVTHPARRPRRARARCGAASPRPRERPQPSSPRWNTPSR